MKKIFNHISIIVLSLLIGIRCQSPESSFTLPEPNPASAEITLDSKSSIMKSIGPEGGMIEIAGTDGWDYRFTIPKEFLVAETEITMTPIASLTSPMLTGFTAGVHFEPDGLVLPGVAWLEITGDVKGDKLIGLTYEGDGDELALNWAEVKGSTIRIPITHFSGGGAGTPAPNAGDRSPTNTMKAMTNSLMAVFLNNDMECIGEDHPLGDFVVVWYRTIFKTKIEPQLKAAVENDLLLSEAINVVLEWTAWRQVTEFFLCPKITQALEEVPETERAIVLMEKGLVNAVDKAADYCATAHDLGEIKHMLAWKAVSQLLPDVEIDLSNQVTKRVKGCLTFELQFESLVEVYEYTNSMTFSAQMKSTIGPLHPAAQGKIMNLIDLEKDSYLGAGPLEYTPKLNYPSKPGCDVVISRIKTEPASAFIPEVKILDPMRYVPINPNKPRQPETKSQETPLPNKSEVNDNNQGGGKKKYKEKIMLIFYKLKATEFIEVTCSDLWGGMDEDGAFGPYTFNSLHEDDWNYLHEGFEFQLEWGYGELFGWATSERNALDIAKEKTTFELIHKAPRVQRGQE